MPALYNFSETEILTFALVLIRLSAFVVTWPVFGVSNIPAQVKILLAMVLAILIFPVVDKSGVSAQILKSEAIIVLVVREALVGLFFGFLGRMFFFALNIAGQIISLSMGISSAEIFDPSTASRTSVVEQIKVALGTLLFLAVNGHHFFLSGISQSFVLLPISATFFDVQAFQSFGSIVQEIMVIGVKMSAPVMVSILFMNLTMAIVGRTVPQVNVLITSLPLNILIGLLVMIVGLPMVVLNMTDLLDLTAERAFQILKAM